jgi:hypothetical protein
MVGCSKTGPETWWVRTRCGSCGVWHETVAPDEAVAAFQRAIRRGVRTVAETATRMEHERMRLEAEAFSQALDLDLIQPDDF